MALDVIADGTGALGRLGDDELLAGLQGLARDKRANDAAMLSHIAEVDRRRLYAREGYTSMFVYCVEALRLSEGAAWKRIWVARLARRYALVLDLIASGELHLAGAARLAKHLTDENHRSVLDRARGKTCKEIEVLVAELAPRADVPASVRKLPAGGARRQASSRLSPGTARSFEIETETEPAGDRSNLDGSSAASKVGRGTLDVCSGAEVGSGTGGGSGSGGGLFAAVAVSERRPAKVEVLAPERYLLKVTLGEEAKAKLDRARDLLRHAVPDGDVAVVFERALDALIEKVEKRKFGKVSRPRAPKTRAGTKAESRAKVPATLVKNPPAALRREVSTRDQERCSYVSPKGKACRATAWLEFHHLIAAARGGPMTVENCALYCNTHNQYAADRDYGLAFMERMRARGRGAGRARERGLVWLARGVGYTPVDGRQAAARDDAGAVAGAGAVAAGGVGASALRADVVPGGEQDLCDRGGRWQRGDGAGKAAGAGADAARQLSRGVLQPWRVDDPAGIARVRLERVDPALLRVLVIEAWERIAPAKLRAQGPGR
jgi:5-methylcytosine-specific restriction endonuclease McrA